MSDEVALALLSLVSTAVTVLARRVHQNTVAVATMTGKFDTILRVLANGVAK